MRIQRPECHPYPSERIATSSRAPCSRRLRLPRMRLLHHKLKTIDWSPQYTSSARTSFQTENGPFV
ncbi:hypothetical protein PMIN01_13463 [Paraphaeosphaeria minitans]|uniref:Uncharacterized protein n=1 Tax=Paraphaeosphaeria minitans TaxID=565426 RepID=A0A9P6KJB9_9PLEO|nr:hypothetical protein PMIN01_13463 [Paraphaeosphaeria minitans]